MTAQELSDFIGESQYAKFTFKCCDCDKHSVIDVERTSETEIKITGGALFMPPVEWGVEDPVIGKCDECYNIQPEFNLPTLVFSRVVGFYRPVSFWNDAKKEEFKMRETYKV